MLINKIKLNLYVNKYSTKNKPKVTYQKPKINQKTNILTKILTKILNIF
jgi:hypothetical protein